MVDWTDYEDMEDEFVEKESRLPKSKPPKKSWKQIKEDKRTADRIVPTDKFSKEILPVNVTGMAQDIDQYIKDKGFQTNEEFRTDVVAAGWFMELETNKQFQNYLKIV